MSARNAGRRAFIPIFNGAPGTARTCNPQIRSLVLYPLSYGRLSALHKRHGKPKANILRFRKLTGFVPLPSQALPEMLLYLEQ